MYLRKDDEPWIESDLKDIQMIDSLHVEVEKTFLLNFLERREERTFKSKMPLDTPKLAKITSIRIDSVLLNLHTKNQSN